MPKHAIVALFLLGRLAPVATTAAQTANSTVTPDRTEVEFRRIEIGPLAR